MERIATATKAVDLFGAGKHGFKDGDPLIPTTPTFLSGAWHNDVQEEISAPIEAWLGALNPADRTQLKQAIEAKIVALIAATGPTTKVSQTGDTMTGALNMSGAPINEAQGANIASSPTPNIAATTGNAVNVTGSTGITGFTAGTTGMRRWLRFIDPTPPLLTHSGGLILPGGNYQPAQYDWCELYCFAGTTWGLINILRFDGTSMRARVASTAASGESELATGAETALLTDGTRSVTPLGLASLVASTTQKGLVLLATVANVDAGTDADKAITSAALAGSVRTIDAALNFNGVTGAINRSFNVSSVVRNSAGNYSVNYTNALPSVFSAPVPGILDTPGPDIVVSSQTTTGCVIRTSSTTTVGSQDIAGVSLIVFGM